MIPSDDELLEQHYEPHEVTALVAARRMLSKLDVQKQHLAGRQLIATLWPEERQRLEKTAWIERKSDPPTLLKLNYAQIKFYEECIVGARLAGKPIRALILKARQLGFSTFMQAWQHYQCFWNANRKAQTVSYDDDSTSELFQKTKFIEGRLWFPRELAADRGELIRYKAPHDSVFYTVTAGNMNAGRSFTFQHLHCSEVPMWPDADTTLVALKQSVPVRVNTSIVLESTARGAVGPFYEEWQSAEAGESDYTPFFAPWFWDPTYELPFVADDESRAFMRTLTPKDLDYQTRYKLSPAQMHWRSSVIRNQLQGNEKMFRQEYPACAAEAFLTSGSPVFDPDAIERLALNVAPPLITASIFLARTES